MQKKTLITCHVVLLLLVSSQAISQLKANFTADITSGCAPIVVKFTDKSTGNPISWRWDLGNGTSTGAQNPSVTYLTPGIYTVKLKVKNAAQQYDSTVKTAFITVLKPPTVNFSSNLTIGCNPLTVNFTDQSGGDLAVSSYQWDFGDGNLSSEKNPAHTYALVGKYSVTLKVTNTQGCFAAQRKADYIKVNGIVAGFTTAANTKCRPDKISFFNTSTSKDSFSCKWDFGDSTYSALLSPEHVYAAGGTYTVKLTVTSNKGCENTFVKTLVVQNPVSAIFNADKTSSCSYPVSIKFTHTETPGNIYQWSFGDSSKSTLPNPSHVYNDSGTYTVKLLVKNTNGCADSLTRIDYIKLHQSSFGFSNLPDSGCKGFTKKMELIQNPADSIISYNWNFGDGTFSTLAAPEKLYSDVGFYNVSVALTSRNGCVDTVSLDNAIHIGNTPVAKFSVDTLIRCAGKTVKFNNLSEQATSWFWDFGNNIGSEDENPSYTYGDTGWVTISLIAMDGGCADTVEAKDYLYLKPAVADFLPINSCSDPFTMQFKNGSVLSDRYLWDFGDGTTSAEYEPSHLYVDTGVYKISLMSSNDSTGCSYTMTRTIKVIKVTPSFFAADTIICRGSTVDFKPYVNADNIAKYLWNFGDGTSLATVKTHITHRYEKSGSYTVTLVTLNTLNCLDTLIKINYINVVGPVAKFTASALSVCAGTPVQFKDSSIAVPGNPVNTWIWKYGDGKTETGTTDTISHVYGAGGTYLPSLKIIDAMGCSDSVTHPVPVTNIKVDAAFSISDPVACMGAQVRFTCPYNGRNIKYSWDFGDSTTDNRQAPLHGYAKEGTYTVKLHIDYNGCTGDYTAVNAVLIRETIAKFAISDSFKTCPPLLINFTDSSYSVKSWHWDFGDSSSSDLQNPSHLYTYPGRYTATLYAKGPGSCVKTMQRTIVVSGPTGSLSFTPAKQCRPYITSFQVKSKDAVSYVWDFNDGYTADTHDSIVTHTYQDSGFFVPKIILVDNAGCKVPVTSKDTLKNLFVKSAFSFPESQLCNNGAIAFTSTSFGNDPIASYQWSFGDSTVSNLKNPSHTYAKAGTYYAQLKVTSVSGCTNQYKSSVPIKIGLTPLIDIAPVVNGCMPLSTSFKGVETGVNLNVLQWEWDFGNGNTANIKNPPAQTYLTDGDYSVRLTVTGSDGCAKSVSKTLTVYGKPSLRTTPDTLVCKDSRVVLSVSGAASYKWSPANAVSCVNCNTTLVNSAASGQYFVVGTSDKGCVSKDSVLVTVKPRPVLSYGGSKNICKGESTQLYAAGTENYKWSPSAGLDNPQSGNPKATPDTTTNYMVVGYDKLGCYHDTGFVNVPVTQLPVVNAGADKSITVGSSTELVATYSPDVTDVKWSPTDAVFRYGETSITVKPKENTEYTVEVKNNGGCSARDKVTVFVLCNGTNVFIPNLFSPNGDGTNDVFYVRGTGLYKVRSLVIFDRWGQAVFKNSNFNSNDPRAGWDGSFKGNKVNADVYVYTIEILCDNNSVLAFNGNVALVR